MKMPWDELIDLVPKEHKKKARELLKQTTRLHLLNYQDHLIANIDAILNANVDFYNDYVACHTDDIDGG